MRIEFPRSLLVASVSIASLFLTFTLLPSAAHAQAATPEQRGSGAGQPTPLPSPQQRQASTGRYHALVIGNQAYASLPRLTRRNIRTAGLLRLRASARLTRARANA